MTSTVYHRYKAAVYAGFTNSAVTELTLIPAMAGDMTPSVVSAENRLVSNGMRQLFRGVVTYHLGFPTQLSISLYLLPVLRGRFESNVDMTGFATTSIVRL